MIRSENILKVINNFKKVLPMAVHENHLDMDECNVNYGGHSCGTTNCHAGWYAIAACDLNDLLDYESGANMMALNLGFKSKEYLKIWATNNPELWGNYYGRNMFSTKFSFSHPTKRPDGALNIKHIIDHWTEVYERVKAIELTTEPPVDNLIESALANVLQPA